MAVLFYRNQWTRPSIHQRIQPKKKFLLMSIAFVALLAAVLMQTGRAAGQSNPESALPRIIILNSYHFGYAWSDNEQAGVIDVLHKENEYWMPAVEYLDLKRHPEGRHLESLKRLFRVKYRDGNFSAIIALDNPALEFAIANRLRIFGNAPVVFCGINNYKSAMLKDHANVTGVVEAIELSETIEVMLHLHPATQEIFCPTDHTETGLAVRREIEALMPRFGPRVRFRFNKPLTMEELLKELERLPGNSLVLETAFITDKSGRAFNVSETTRLFYEHSPVPIYSVYLQRLGFGIVGGKLLSGRRQGEIAARIALKILAGEKISAIPVVSEGGSRFMFDYRVMNRFGIPVSALPEGSAVINRPLSFFAEHRTVLQTAFGIGIILLIIIFLLVFIIVQRRRSTTALCASEAKYLDFYQNAPDMYLSLDGKTGIIVECNDTFVRAMGYPRNEIVGCPIFEICHPDCQENARRVIETFAKTGTARSSDLKIVRKDGVFVDISLNASAVRDDEGRITHGRAILHDITGLKQVQGLLVLKERRLDLAQSAANAGMWEWDVVTGQIKGSGHLFKLFGLGPQRQEASSEDWRNVLHPEDLRTTVQRLEISLKEGIHFDCDYRIILPDGRIRWINAVGDAEYDGRGKPVRMIGVCIDITERKQVEDTLRRNEENFRRSFDDSPLGVRIVTEDGDTIYANRAILDIYGYDGIEELRENPVRKRYTAESYAEYQIRRKKRKGHADVLPEYEVSIVRKDGGIRHLRVFRKPIVWDGKKQDQVVYQDITESKRTEQYLRNFQEQLRALAGRLQVVREEERTQIAREIHDELGGALTGLKIDASSLARSVRDIENKTTRTSLLACVDAMGKSIETTIQAVRRIAMELRPGVLDDLGLIAALEWQIGDFQKRTGICCQWVPSVDYIDLEIGLSTALFRIVQEALTNVARHSGATEVSVRLHMENNSLILDVEDNGKGIKKRAASGLKSLGLLGMRERAQMFGGRITVTGTPGKGTKVTVEVPPVEKREKNRSGKGATDDQGDYDR